MDLYSALMSGVSEKDLREKFEQQLAEARMKRQAEKEKEDNKTNKRRVAAKALTDYVRTILSEVPDNTEEMFNRSFLIMEREIERGMETDTKRERIPSIDADSEILKAFLKTL